jgi:hypothetical protein
MMRAEGEGAGPIDRAWTRWQRAAPAWFYAVVLGLACLWLFLLPFDATDLCYLLSLEDRVWVTQEVVHPLWVPLLWLYRFVLRGVGWHGLILVPLEVANILVSVVTLVLLFRLARRLTNDALSSASAVLLLATCTAFGSAAMRPTPYALAFLCLTGSLMLLVGGRRPSRLGYLAAGALAGAAMALHASAMALAPTALLCAALDPERESWSDAAARVASYGAGMAIVASACWTGWLLFNGLDASFFAIAHLRSLFGGVEQVPGTSIYSSGSWWKQVVGFYASLRDQGGLLLVVGGLVAMIAEVRRAVRHDVPTRPVDRRLLVAALAAFVTVAGFFFVNNYRNGFIYACLALVPVVVARAASRWPGARRLLGATPLLAVPLAVPAALSGTHRFRDPLPIEARFVESTLGPRAVLLVPGCAFSELRLLSSLNVFRVQLEASGPVDCVLPWAPIGHVLRARVRSWQDQGVRVFLAYGDEERDFSGDANGEEKAVQLFWSPELAAKDRAPELRAVRSAFASAGLHLDEPFVSPHGARYGEVTVEGAADAPPPGVAAGNFESSGTHHVNAGITRGVLARFHALVPRDPWAPCDELCQGLTEPVSGPSASGNDPSRDVRSECGCPESADSSSRTGPEPPPHSACHFGPHFDEAAAKAYIARWTQEVGLGVPIDWGVRFDDDRAQVRLKLPGGTLWLTWRLQRALLGLCAPTAVEMRNEGLPPSALPSADVVQDFAARLPAPRPGGG